MFFYRNICSSINGKIAKILDICKITYLSIKVMLKINFAAFHAPVSNPKAVSIHTLYNKQNGII